MSEKTIGEERIRTDFNPSNSDDVNSLKADFAKLINKMEGVKIITDNFPDKESGEVKRLAAIAQTKIEEAAMWSVKALTAL